jgi:hypothetical protein
MSEHPWPELPLDKWKDTYATLHMWTQMVGKVRLALTPRVNHWWEVPLYVNASGLTTSAIPCRDRIFEVQFDFIEHQLLVLTSDGRQKSLALRPQSVADFYRAFLQALSSLGIEVRIWPMPVEVPNPVRFDLDHEHASYDAEYAHRFWTILTRLVPIFSEFRGRFIGKHSPIHFFLGEFRPGLDPLLGAARARASGGRFNHARGLFTRGHQRGFLAGWSRGGGSGLLCLCCARTTRLQDCNDQTRESVLFSSWGIPADVRRCAAGEGSAQRFAGLPADHLRGGSKPGQLAKG